MKKQNLLMLPLILSACVASQKPTDDTITRSGIDKSTFSKVVDGKPVALYTLTNANGLEVAITNFGGRIVSVWAPDRNGKFADVVLGHETLDGYLTNNDNFGALIGRYGNRIANGRFTLDSVEYQLPQNNFGHCLHGGPDGYDRKIWNVVAQNDSILQLTYLSPDGEAGFPGNLDILVTYQLTSDNALKIGYKATTDKATVVNLTNHSYFNLSGDPNREILDHEVVIAADAITPIDTTFMTTGEIVSVEGTAFDFRQPHTIGERISKSDCEQLHNGRGYDHNWVVGGNGSKTRFISRVVEPASGRTLEVYTNEPGVQLYTGNFLDGTVSGKKNIAYQQHTALCLETQHYPDTPNKSEWPSCRLNPGETYTSECIYKFGVQK